MTIRYESSTAKCKCQHCNQSIEFDIFQAGQTVQCPNCQMETMLFVPPVASQSPPSQKKGTLFAVIVILLAGNIFWAVLYFRHHHRDITVEAAVAPIAKTETIAASEQSPEEKKRERETNDKNAMLLIAGVYQCQMYSHSIGVLDLRSDGSARYSPPYNSEEHRAISWTIEGGKINILNHTWKLEGSDLIDSTGNRWMRAR